MTNYSPKILSLFFLIEIFHNQVRKKLFFAKKRKNLKKFKKIAKKEHIDKTGRKINVF